MTCTRCHRPHKGRYVRCYPCRKYEKHCRVYRAQMEIGTHIGNEVYQVLFKNGERT